MRAFEYQALEPRRLLATSTSPLVERLAQHAGAVPGDAGVGVVRIGPDGAVAETFVNADVSFGTSSTIKIGILYALMRRIDANPNDGITPNTTLDVGTQYGNNQGDTLSPNGVYTLTALARTMIHDSNNWATNRLIDYVGMANINAQFDALGLVGTELSRYMTGPGAISAHGNGAGGPAADYRDGFDNVSTVREFTSLLRQVHQNDGLLTPSSHALFFQLLGGDSDDAPNDSRSYVSDYYFGTDRALLTGGDWDPFANKIGSNTWTGNPGDFAKDPNLGDHLQRSEAGRLSFADGTIVFYAGYVDNAAFVDDDDPAIDTQDEVAAEAQEVLARFGYEIGAEYSGAAVAATPASAALDDGRVVTVRGGASGDSIRINADIFDDGDLAVEVNGVDVGPVDLYAAGAFDYDRVRVQTFGGADVVTIAGWPIVDGASIPFDVETGADDDTVIVLADGLQPDAGDVGGGPGFDVLILDLAGRRWDAPSVLDDTDDFERIEIVNAGGTPLAPGTPAVLAGVEGGQFVGEVVGRFTDADPGARASDYAATIGWGDGTTSAGLVIQDASDPIVFHVAGDHTYRRDGMFAISVTVRDLGGTSTQTDAGVTGTRTFLPETPVVLAASATVADAPIAAWGVSFSGPEALPLDVTAAYFTTTAPEATASDYAATIDWGDGTTSAGTISFVGVSPAGLTFRVAGIHAYARDGRYSVEARITSGGGSGGLAGGEAVVADRLLPALRLPSLNIHFATVGMPMTASGVAIFTDAGILQSLASYSAAIDWGDGSPASPGTLKIVGTEVVVRGVHTFVRAGDFVGRVTINSAGGATISIPFLASASPVQFAFHVPTVAEDVPLHGVALATMTAAWHLPPDPTYYTVVIDWGDGTPIVPGFIDAAGRVLGSHTYREPGAYGVRIVVGIDGHPSLLASSSTLVVTERPIVLTGALAPESDTGRSNSDGVTSDAAPTFFGTSEPFSSVRVYLGSDPSSRREIAAGVADAAGSWSATATSPLADGEYAGLTSEAVDADGVTRATIALPRLVVDTVGPRVVDLIFHRLGGRIYVSFQDDRSGLEQSSIVDGANYRFGGRSVARPRAAWRLVTGASTTAPAAASDVQVVALTINEGRPMRGGFYDLVARSGGVVDAAGNALDGEFYGDFASGQGRPGGDFSTRLRSLHELTLKPQPDPNGYASPNPSRGTPGRRFHVGRVPRPLGPAGLRKAGASALPRLTPLARTPLSRHLQGLARPGGQA